MSTSPARPLSLAEVSARENIPGRTVRYAVEKGHLKAHKLPGRTGAWLIYERDLNRWLAGRTDTATS